MYVNVCGVHVVSSFKQGRHQIYGHICIYGAHGRFWPTQYTYIYTVCMSCHHFSMDVTKYTVIYAYMVYMEGFG